jgi:hypothetical protein
MKISSYSLLVRIAKMRIIRNVIPTGRDWDSISFAVVYVMDKKSAENKTFTGLSIGDNREEMALEQQVAQPACSNTSRQNRPSQQHEVLLDD